jgi:hypothetical protein
MTRSNSKLPHIDLTRTFGFMDRTATVIRRCPKCDASFRIPVIFSTPAGTRRDGGRFELGLGLGCPNQFAPGHGPLTTHRLRALVRYGAAPNEERKSAVWTHTVGALAGHRRLARDNRI